MKLFAFNVMIIKINKKKNKLFKNQRKIKIDNRLKVKNNLNQFKNKYRILKKIIIKYLKI